jgi:hypothetical protein
MARKLASCPWSRHCERLAPKQSSGERAGESSLSLDCFAPTGARNDEAGESSLRVCL